MVAPGRVLGLGSGLLSLGSRCEVRPDHGKERMHWNHNSAPEPQRLDFAGSRGRIERVRRDTEECGRNVNVDRGQASDVADHHGYWAVNCG